MTTRFHHINLTSKNSPELESFYKDVLELSGTDAYSGGKQIKNQGYGGHVAFLTDGTSEMHLSTLDLNVAFRTGQAINPLERGHIAFRTDDIEGDQAPTDRARRTLRRLRGMGHRGVAADLLPRSRWHHRRGSPGRRTRGQARGLRPTSGGAAVPPTTAGRRDLRSNAPTP